MSMDRITALEEALAHQTRVTEELSCVAAEQAERIAGLEKRVRLLLERAAAAEAEQGGGAYFTDETPPHY